MAGWLNRALYAVREGVSAFRQYNREYVVPTSLVVSSPATLADWDSYEARLYRYYLFTLYEHNVIYTQLERAALAHLRTEGLYKYTRSLFNPIARAISIEASKCYGGALDTDGFEHGAIPLRGADQRVIDAVARLFKWSDFARAKMDYARKAARYGDAVIKVVDDVQSEKVRLEVLHPGVLRDADVDSVGFIKRAVIEYPIPDPTQSPEQRADDNLRRDVIYREVITQDSFSTYIVRENGEAEPYPFGVMANGERVAVWENPYGFVPLVIAKARDEGKWGLPLYQTAIPKIDAANSMASLILDQVQKAVVPNWGFFGFRSIADKRSRANQTDEDFSGSLFGGYGFGKERSAITFIKIGDKDARIEPLVAPLDIRGALESLQRLLDEIEDDIPELAFAHVRKFRLESALALKDALGDAIARLEEFNGNMDAPLRRAIQMGISIGGFNRYDGFESFGLDDYQKGNLDFDIAPRSIVENSLTLAQEIQAMLQADVALPIIWRRMGLSTEEIAQSQVYAEDEMRRATSDFARVLSSSAFGGRE